MQYRYELITGSSLFDADMSSEIKSTMVHAKQLLAKMIIRASVALMFIHDDTLSNVITTDMIKLLRFLDIPTSWYH